MPNTEYIYLSLFLRTIRVSGQVLNKISLLPPSSIHQQNARCQMCPFLLHLCLKTYKMKMQTTKKDTSNSMKRKKSLMKLSQTESVYRMRKLKVKQLVWKCTRTLKNSTSPKYRRVLTWRHTRKANKVRRCH